MEFQDVVRKRRMVRGFEHRPLARDVVQRILATARRGASSGFTQGFEFLVFDGPEQAARFWRHMAANAGTGVVPADVMVAPLIIVSLAHAQTYVRRYREPDKAHVGRQNADDWPAPYWFIDTGFAALLFLLTAVDAELGACSCSLGATSQAIPPFRRAFGIPEVYYPVGASAIGYPAPDLPSLSLRRERRPQHEVMHFGAWGGAAERQSGPV
jgi:nitroreductase